MLDTSIQIKTEQFDGPLGLLLKLVQKEDIDISDVNLNSITEQYLEYLDRMQELDFYVAGEYLYLAATLVLLKSRRFIHQDDINKMQGQFDVEDEMRIESQEELLRRLKILANYQRIGKYLWSMPKKGHQVFTRPRRGRKEVVNAFVLPGELEKLTTAMIDILYAQKHSLKVIDRDPLSVKKKLLFLKNYLQQGQQTDLDTILEQDGTSSISNTVVTFISLLELSRLGWVNLFQNKEYGALHVEVLNSMNEFDVDSANGFMEQVQ